MSTAVSEVHCLFIKSFYDSRTTQQLLRTSAIQLQSHTLTSCMQNELHHNSKSLLSGFKSQVSGFNSSTLRLGGYNPLRAGSNGEKKTSIVIGEAVVSVQLAARTRYLDIYRLFDVAIRRS